MRIRYRKCTKSESRRLRAVQVTGAQFEHRRLFEDLTHGVDTIPKGPGHRAPAGIFMCSSLLSQYVYLHVGFLAYLNSAWIPSRVKPI